MKCVVTGIERRETPEELVRQAIAHELIQRYGYRKEDLRLELPIQMGSSSDKRADIAIFRPDIDPKQRTQHTAYIIVECKRADVSDYGYETAKEQLKSYLATCHNSHFGMVIAGKRRTCFREIKHPDGRYEFVEIRDIPFASTPKPRFTVVGSAPLQAPYDRRSLQAPAVAPISEPAKAGKLLHLAILGAALLAVILVGTCIAVVPWSSSPAQRSAPPNRSPNVADPVEPGRNRCSLSSWDGAVRGWAKGGAPQCGQPRTETGYYLRVAFGQDKAASEAAVAQAWRRYIKTYLGGGACPSAKEMVFFDPTGESGSGILFSSRPPNWDAVIQKEPQWRLLDGRNQPLSAPVCFFLAEESRRPADWPK